MRPISEFAGQELVWSQPAALRREHELRAGDELVANLKFERRTLAAAEAADGRWTFKREGFWHPRVTARTTGEETDLAIFSPRWSGGGQLDFTDGRSWRLASANFWQSQWVWEQGRDQPLIRFMGRHGLMKASGAVDIAPEAASRPELPMLVLLGWYLILLYAEDAAAATTAAVVPTIASG